MKAAPHSHNIQLAHSWIMVLATNNSSRRKSSTTTNKKPAAGIHHQPPTATTATTTTETTTTTGTTTNSSNRNQMLQPVSPFSEFTGCHYYNNTSNSSSKKQQNPRRSPDTLLATLKAKHLLESFGGPSPKAVQVAVVKPKTGIPAEIVTMRETHVIPGTIFGNPDNDDCDVHSEISIQDALEQQMFLTDDCRVALQQHNNSNSNISSFPPLSKHHTQHDATWGITTTRLQDDYGNDNDVVDWPSDEEKSLPFVENTMCAATSSLVTTGMNCSGLKFWTKGAVHQQNLDAAQTHARTAAPVNFTATRDEENTSYRSGSRNSRDNDVLEPAWSAYEEFHLQHQHASTAPPVRGQLVYL